MKDPNFFKEELRDGFLVTPQMKKVWACQLDLLNQLLNVCNKHELKCWADSGTLIGAIRHKGYIPWDDDIDMVMLRADFDKLLEVAPIEFKTPYFFQTIYTDNHYKYRHAQLRNSQTSAIPQTQKGRKTYNQGIFLDIFILDSYPEKLKTAYKTMKKIRRHRIYLKYACALMNMMPNCIYQKWRLDNKIFKKYEDVLRNNNAESPYVSCVSLDYKQKIKSLDCYSDVLWVDFENMKIPIPNGYDEILRIDYGDYMVPEHKLTLHGVMKYNTEKSYMEI